ncbi:T6SS immunity protein Tli4 family protein [Massilia aurea]|uniref:T6SS immunity protein Tli4 family protein n=1 Tax=Massilia aurea TaxID=373040 RepID=UPI0034624DE2
MKKFLYHPIAWVVGILVLTIVIINPLEGKVTSSSKKMDEIFTNTRVVCFGRLRVTIPETASVIYGPITVDGNMQFYRNQSSSIASLVESRLQSVQEEKSYLADYSLAKLPMVGKVVDGIIPGQKIVFGAKSSVSYAIHSYIPMEGDLFIQYISSVMPSADSVSLVNKVAGQLSLRSENEIPEEMGMCIEGGFVQVNADYESSAIGIYLKEIPDVRISIEARKNHDNLQGGSSPRKLRRQAEERAVMLGFGNFFSRIKVLRDGARQLGIWHGEEILTRRPAYKDDTDAHEFRFFSVGEKNSALHPLLDVRLDSGVKGDAKAKVKPSLTDEEALALWDRVLPSIGVRQPSDATPSNEVPLKTPLGAISKSGEICPQSGFWECTDKRKIDGARRRLFTQGEKIPPVIATGYISLLRTLIGDVYRVAYVDWKLTAYETIPTASGDVDGKPDEDDRAEDTHA